jgi:hypothetical protein
MQPSFSLKRIALGIVLVSVGLALLAIKPYPLYFHAPIDVVLLFLITIFLKVTTIMLGGFIITIGIRTEMQKDATRMLIIPIILFGFYTFLVALPILLLPLPEEATVLTLSASSLLLVLIMGYFEKRKTKHKKVIEEN